MTGLLSLSVVSAVCAQAPARVRWDDVLRQPAEWYGSADARAVADNVLRYQRQDGGWPKDVDMAAAPAAPPMTMLRREVRLSQRV